MHLLLAVLLLLVPVRTSPNFEFTPEAQNTLDYLYINLEVEFAFCAYGKKGILEAFAQFEAENPAA
jgi:hypothetical protein